MTEKGKGGRVGKGGELTVDEKYTQWKSLVPILYDWLANHNLVWPSLSCRWGPLLEQATYKNRQRLYLSEQTDGSVPNTLVIANVEVVKPRVAAAEHISQFNEEARSPFVKKFKTIIHPGEVNRIRELPQNSNIVATHTDSPDVLIWDVENQPSRHAILGAPSSRPDLILTGHQENAEFALAMCSCEPMVLSGGKDKLVVLWNINDHISTLATEPGAAKSASAGSNIKSASKTGDGNNGNAASPSVEARGIYKGHDDTVEDVQFCPTSAQQFCSVGDDSCLILWDSRTGLTPATKVEKAHDADLHCVDWNPHDENFILTGSADNSIHMFDRRNISANGKSLVVVAYNPLGWNRSDVIRIPVDNANLVVQDSLGNVVESQYLDMDNVTINLRNLYTKAYLGKSSKKVPKFWLAFGVSLQPLGWNTYFIMERNGKGRINRSSVAVVDRIKDQIVDIGPGNVKMSFSSSGQLLKMSNSDSRVDVPLQQSFLYYTSMGGEDGQASGAYIFRPSGDPTVIHNNDRMVVVRGVLMDEIHQQFDSWIYQVTRLYRDKEHAEVEFTIGPIPVDFIGKEVITRMETKLATNKEFYTDSNGRDFLKRIRNHREDWKLSVNEPVAGNYYPINLGIFANDSNYEFSVLVDRATGGASIEDGQIELMLHRRLLADDSRGVGEPLNEEVCVEDSCSGLIIRGHYYVNIHKLGAGAQWRRTTGQEVYSPLLLAFTHENSDSWKASRSTKGTSMDSNYSLPLNVALITLQELEDKYVLLRLAHLYEAGEDAEYSRMAIVELRKMFSGKQIKEVKEMSLSANQEKSEMKRLKWRVEGEDTSNVGARDHNPLRGSPVDGSTLVVELGPMEIRTFLLKF